MSGKAKLILNVKKLVRGGEVKPGAVLLEGECLNRFTADDLSKAIQLGQVTVEVSKSAPAAKKDKE